MLYYLNDQICFTSDISLANSLSLIDNCSIITSDFSTENFDPDDFVSISHVKSFNDLFKQSHHFIQFIKNIAIDILLYDTVYIFLSKNKSHAAVASMILYSFIENKTINEVIQHLSSFISLSTEVIISSNDYIILNKYLQPYIFEEDHFLSNTSKYNVYDSKLNINFYFAEACYHANKRLTDNNFITKLSKVSSIQQLNKYKDIDLLLNFSSTQEQENGHTLRLCILVNILIDKIKTNEKEWNHIVDKIGLSPIICSYEEDNELGKAWKIALLKYINKV